MLICAIEILNIIIIIIIIIIIRLWQELDWRRLQTRLPHHWTNPNRIQTNSIPFEKIKNNTSTGLSRNKDNTSQFNVYFNINADIHLNQR